MVSGFKGHDLRAVPTRPCSPCGDPPSMATPPEVPQTLFAHHALCQDICDAHSEFARISTAVLSSARRDRRCEIRANVRTALTGDLARKTLRLKSCAWHRCDTCETPSRGLHTSARSFCAAALSMMPAALSPVRNGRVGDWRLGDDTFLDSFSLPGLADKCNTLAESHPFARDRRIVFEESKHEYFLDGKSPAPRDKLCPRILRRV